MELGGLTPPHDAVAIATRWSYLAEAVLADPDFIVWLGRAREVQKEGARLRSRMMLDADGEQVTQARIRAAQARLGAYLADSRLKRHIGADDLNKIVINGPRKS